MSALETPKNSKGGKAMSASENRDVEKDLNQSDPNTDLVCARERQKETNCMSTVAIIHRNDN